MPSVNPSFTTSPVYSVRSRNPATGLQQRKVVGRDVRIVKRVVSHGLPILIGSGYYLNE